MFAANWGEGLPLFQLTVGKLPFTTQIYDGPGPKGICSCCCSSCCCCCCCSSSAGAAAAAAAAAGAAPQGERTASTSVGKGSNPLGLPPATGLLPAGGLLLARLSLRANRGSCKSSGTLPSDPWDSRLPPPPTRSMPAPAKAWVRDAALVAPQRLPSPASLTEELGASGRFMMARACMSRGINRYIE